MLAVAKVERYICYTGDLIHTGLLAWMLRIKRSCAPANKLQKTDLKVEFLKGDCAAIALPDKSIDLMFCHQTFHHLVYQGKALAEFYRILKPGGLLLFAESTRAYIDTWFIRILFRHPNGSAAKC